MMIATAILAGVAILISAYFEHKALSAPVNEAKVLYRAGHNKASIAWFAAAATAVGMNVWLGIFLAALGFWQRSVGSTKSSIAERFAEAYPGNLTLMDIFTDVDGRVSTEEMKNQARKDKKVKAIEPGRD